MKIPFLSSTMLLILHAFVLLHVRTSNAYSRGKITRPSSTLPTDVILRHAINTPSIISATTEVAPSSSSPPGSLLTGSKEHPDSLKQMSCKRFVKGTLAVAFMTLSMSLQALAESEDKGYSLCLSKCIYAGTRPPPQGSSNERLEVTPPRSEIIKECKEKCTLKTGYVPPKKEKVKKTE